MGKLSGYVYLAMCFLTATLVQDFLISLIFKQELHVLTDNFQFID